eukprot:scaffold9487_cov171-Skeletonema_marinoi.AAC.2
MKRANQLYLLPFELEIETLALALLSSVSCFIRENSEENSGIKMERQRDVAVEASQKRGRRG